jgi:uncharacterized protein YcfJ
MRGVSTPRLASLAKQPVAEPCSFALPRRLCHLKELLHVAVRSDSRLSGESLGAVVGGLVAAECA